MTVWRTDDRALRVQVGGATAPGHGRDMNQDAEIVAAGVFGVAGGVGGTGGGEVASGIAASQVVLAVAVGQDGTQAAQTAHEAVEKGRASDARLRDMATTLCVGVAGWHGNTAAVQVTNVGDSRAYLGTPPGDAVELRERALLLVRRALTASGVPDPGQANDVQRI